MGLITTVLDLIPLPTDSNLAKAKKLIKVGKTAYNTTTKVDKVLDISGKVGKGVFNTIGPASPGLIDKVDKARTFFHKYNTEAKLAKEAGKLLQKGYSKIVKSFSTKTLPQNPSAKAKLNKVLPAHSTPFSKTTPAAKGPSLNLPSVPSLHLRKPKLGRSLHLKSYKAGLNLGNQKSKLNMMALANNKLFTIKTQASKSNFNPAKSKAFTIKTQANASKFSLTRNKISIRPKGPFMPKLNTPKLRPPSFNTKAASKSPLTNRSVFKSPSNPRPPMRPSLSKNTMKSPFKR